MVYDYTRFPEFVCYGFGNKFAYALLHALFVAVIDKWWRAKVRPVNCIQTNICAHTIIRQALKWIWVMPIAIESVRLTANKTGNNALSRCDLHSICLCLTHFGGLLSACLLVVDGKRLPKHTHTHTNTRTLATCPCGDGSLVYNPDCASSNYLCFSVLVSRRWLLASG